MAQELNSQITQKLFGDKKQGFISVSKVLFFSLFYKEEKVQVRGNSPFLLSFSKLNEQSSEW